MIKLIEECHSLHSEDAILKGKDYIERMLTFYEDSIKMLKGEKTATNFSVKWDGAPAILMFSETERFGGPGISTKSLFNTNPKYYASEEEIMKDDRPEGLKTKLLTALKLAQENIIPSGEIWQGDMLFTKGDQKIKSENGIDYVAVQPNTLLYMAPVDSEVGRQISNADIGIVWHTRYDENGQNQSNDATVDKLQNIPEWAFMLDAKVPNLSGKVSINEKESAVFSKALNELYDYCNKITSHYQYDALINNKDFIDFYIMTFQNHKYDVNQEIDPTNFVEELHQWITKKMHKQYNGLDKLKTKKGRDNKRLVIQSTSKELHLIVKSNEKLIDDIAHGLKVATEIKNGLLDKLNIIDSWITKYEDYNGLHNTGHEGFVVSNSNGDFVKFVDRSAFSHLNRDSSVIKGWEGDTRTQITEAKTKKKDIFTCLTTGYGSYGTSKNKPYKSYDTAKIFLDKLVNEYNTDNIELSIIGSDKKGYFVSVEEKDNDKESSKIKHKDKLKQSQNDLSILSILPNETKDDKIILSKYLNFLVKEAKITPDNELWKCIGRKHQNDYNKTVEYLSISSSNTFKGFYILKKAGSKNPKDDFDKLSFPGKDLINLIIKNTKNNYTYRPAGNDVHTFINNTDKTTYRFKLTGEPLYKEGGEKNSGEFFENILALEMTNQMTKNKYFEQLQFGGNTEIFTGEKFQDKYMNYVPQAVQFMATKKSLYYNDKKQSSNDYIKETFQLSDKFKNMVKDSLFFISKNNINNIKKIVQCGSNETHRGIEWKDEEDDLIGGKNIKNIAEALADIIVVENGPDNLEIKKYCSAKSGSSHGIATYGISDKDTTNKETMISVRSNNILRFLKSLFSIQIAEEIYKNMSIGISKYDSDDTTIIPNKIISSQNFKNNVNTSKIIRFLESCIGNSYYIIHYNYSGGGNLETSYLGDKEVFNLTSKYLNGSIGIKYPNSSSRFCYIYLNSDKNGNYKAIENSPFGKIAIAFEASIKKGVQPTIDNFNSIKVTSAHTKESLLSFEDIYRMCLR